MFPGSGPLPAASGRWQGAQSGPWAAGTRRRPDQVTRGESAGGPVCPKTRPSHETKSAIAGSRGCVPQERRTVQPRPPRRERGSPGDLCSQGQNSRTLGGRRPPAPRPAAAQCAVRTRPWLPQAWLPAPPAAPGQRDSPRGPSRLNCLWVLVPRTQMGWSCVHSCDLRVLGFCENNVARLRTFLARSLLRGERDRPSREVAPLGRCWDEGHAPASGPWLHRDLGEHDCPAP